MFRKEGMTLMEILVVLIMIAIAAAFFLPNFTSPTEKSRSQIAQNNLLAIYSAQQNYNNNYNGFCLSTTAAQTACNSDANCGDTLAALNCNLSLNIPDDGSYTYRCDTDATGFICKAIRSNQSFDPAIQVTNQPIVVGGGANPLCTTANNWCP